MANNNSGKKIVLAIVIVAAVATGIVVWRHKKSTISTSPASQPATQQTVVNHRQPAAPTADFSYTTPNGWAALSQSVLSNAEAVSGIGRTSVPTAQFTVKVSDAIPKSNQDLQTSTLTELKKFNGFKLVSSKDVTISGVTGRKFSYSFNSGSAVRQDLVVVVHKQKTFFLLVTSDAATYDTVTPEFAGILTSFSFK